MALVQYSYSARNSNGQISTGHILASNRPEALLILRRRGLEPFRISVVAPQETGTGTRAEHGALLERASPTAQRIDARQLSVLVRQLAELLQAGIPVDRSLALLTKVPLDRKRKVFLSTAYEEVRKGNPLSTAWGNSFMGFPLYGWSMLQAGEASGRLETSLFRIADVLEGNAELHSLVLTSIAYPVLLFVVSLSVVVVLLVYAIPQFLAIFTLWGEELPHATRMLVCLSDHVRTFGPMVISVVVLSVIGAMVWRSTPKGGYCWDSLLLRLPVLGTAIGDVASARMFKTMAAMLAGGVLLPQSMRLGAKTSGNARLTRALHDSAQKVEDGAQLAQALRGEAIFPESVVELVTMGEEAGDLVRTLEQAVRMLDEDIRRRVKYMTALLEPAMILLMAVVVGFVVISILLPVVNMMDMPI
ncbi:MAG: type II secretion system F family protein [Limnochordia bacterium]|nr:type II secretion system F family protein [Limnochordia bacterium]